ncbi:unnamed protein product [Diamesa tonsa]
MILLWKIIIAVNFVSIFVDCQFENQYLGHYLTREQYNGRELACDTKVCLSDAQLLLLKATQNKTIEPCDDFEEFSMGQFKKLGALNERYSFIGFMRDIVLLNWERKRKILAEKIKDTDIRPFKIAKNFYQRCVNSDNIRTNGSVEILQHVKSYGGAPFLDSSWDENAFNIKELFNKEPFNAVYFFLNQTIELCTHPQNQSREIVCLRKSTLKKFNGIEINDSIQMFKVFDIDGVVESFLKIERNNKKLKLYPESKKQFHWLSDLSIKFVLDENVICKFNWYLNEKSLIIHQSMILYPFYHPNRSHFFNTATLYQFTAESMNHLIRLYLQTKWDTQIKLIDTLELSYKNYVKWEESGGKELQLPGFFLTNRQMFWVALAHKKYHKFQTGISKITLKKFQHRHTHFHLQLKNQLSFRQAYNCTELTEDEKNKLNKYYSEKEMFERQYIIDYQLMYP